MPSLSLRQLASRPSTKTTASHTTSNARPSLSISIRSVRRHLSRRLRHKQEDEFTDLDSQSGFGSTPPIDMLLDEKERGWVVLVPEKIEMLTPPAPPIPKKDHYCSTSPMCLSFPSPDTRQAVDVETEGGRGVHVQSPHLGHRSPNHHQRQSVLSYISVGRWSASTQGRGRRRKWVIGVTTASIVGVIILTGVLAGLLSKRKDE